MGTRTITRRGLLGAMGGGAALALSACAPRVVKETVVVEVEKVVKESVEVEKEVTRVVEKVGEPPELTGTVKMWAWDEFIAEYMTRGFMAKYPGAKAEHEIIHNYAETFLASLVAGAGLPDAAWIDSHTYQKLARTGQLLPLDDYQEPYREHLLDHLYEGGICDGVQYGCPRRYANELLWYRKDRFEEAGIDPAEIKTWDDFMRLGQRATGDGKFMTVFDEGGFDFALQCMIFGKEGTGFFDSQDNVVVDSAENLANLEKWYEMIKAGTMRPMAHWQPDWWDAVNNARLACIVMPYWFGGDLFSENFPDTSGKWGVLRIPSLKEGVENASVWQGAMYWVIPRRAANPELGWKLIEYTTFDYQDMIMQESLDRELVLPAYTRFMEVDYFWGEMLLYFGENLRQKANLLAQGAPVNYLPPEYNEAVTAFVVEITKMREGAVTPKQALASAAAEFNKLLQVR